jgi:hypothetical protein
MAMVIPSLSLLGLRDAEKLDHQSPIMRCREAIANFCGVMHLSGGKKNPGDNRGF